jgi:hypothetical protein
MAWNEAAPIAPQAAARLMLMSSVNAAAAAARVRHSTSNSSGRVESQQHSLLRLEQGISMSDFKNAANAADDFDRESRTREPQPGDRSNPLGPENPKEQLDKGDAGDLGHPFAPVDRDEFGRFEGRKLTPAERAAVLGYAGKASHGKLADRFRCSRSQISKIFADERRRRAKA